MKNNSSILFSNLFKLQPTKLLLIGAIDSAMN